MPAAAWTDLPAAGAAADLLAAARAAYDVPPGAEIVAAPGTQALIQWLPRLAPPGPVAILSPTYGEHAASWVAGHEVLVCRAPEHVPSAARHIVVVSPNNPDGRVLPYAAYETLARHAAERGGWLVIDAAFADVAATAQVGKGAIVLRSFGKFFGLAGLRLGFAIAPPAIATMLRPALGPWAVAGPALTIGTAALRDRAWAGDMRRKLYGEADKLDALLAAGGCTPVGGTSLFRLVRHHDAAALHVRLAEARIWCRRFAEAPDLLRFGLPADAAAAARLRAALT